MKDILEIAKKAALEAGDYLAGNFGKKGDIFSKGDRNLVTEYDRAAEKIIVGILRDSFPSYGVLAEEEAKFGLDNEYLWIIDPLDGTHNFIRNIGIFGTSIGLWHDGKFILGVIYMPLENELYYALSGEGAYKNNKRIKTSSLSLLKDASGVFDSSIRYSPGIMLRALENISKEAFNIRMLGSSVRQLSFLAEGKIDFVIEFHDRPWDYAAGACIVKEAGGVFLDLRGKLPSPKTIGYIASNALVYPALADTLGDIFKK